MGEERTKVEDILRRIDDLIRILKFLSEDLVEISKNLKASLSVPKEPQPHTPLLPPKSTQQTISLEKQLKISSSLHLLAMTTLLSASKS